VVDKTQLYKDVLKDNESYIFQFTDASVDELKNKNKKTMANTPLYFTSPTT